MGSDPKQKTPYHPSMGGTVFGFSGIDPHIGVSFPGMPQGLTLEMDAEVQAGPMLGWQMFMPGLVMGRLLWNIYVAFSGFLAIPI